MIEWFDLAIRATQCGMIIVMVCTQRRANKSLRKNAGMTLETWAAQLKAYYKFTEVIDIYADKQAQIEERLKRLEEKVGKGAA